MEKKIPEEVELPLLTATASGAGISPIVTGAALLEGIPILHAVALFPATIIGFALMGVWFGIVMYVLVNYLGL